MRKAFFLVPLVWLVCSQTASEGGNLSPFPHDVVFGIGSGFELMAEDDCATSVTDNLAGPLPTEEDQAKARYLVMKYGSSPLAYSALEPQVRYHFGEDGFVPYAVRYGVHFVLEGPIASKSHSPALLKDFLGKHPNTCLCAASYETARMLSGPDFNHYANEMGEIADLDLENYSFTGGERASIRRAHNRVVKHFDIFEGSWSDFASQDLIQVSESWRKDHGAITCREPKCDASNTKSFASEKELAFLSRPLHIDSEEPDVRKFFVVSKSEPRHLVAYYVFDPMYEDGEVIGYHLNFKRRASDADPKTEEAVVMFATEQFQRESKRRKNELRPPIKYLSMGLLPAFNVTDAELPHSRSLSFVIRGFERASRYPFIARRTFNFHGHGRFKSRFGGTHRKMFFTTPFRWNARTMLGLMDLCNVKVWGVSPTLHWVFGESNGASTSRLDP